MGFYCAMGRFRREGTSSERGWSGIQKERPNSLFATQSSREIRRLEKFANWPRNLFSQSSPVPPSSALHAPSQHKLLAHQDYFGFWGKFANFSSGLQSIQRWESHGEENQSPVAR